MDDIPIGWRTQVSSGVFWVVSGLCVGGFDIYNGWRFGAKLSPVIGLIFAAAGVFVMVLRGRDWLTRISLWGCLLVTITAGYAAYTTDLGGALGNDGAQHNRYETALGDAEKARKKLSSIKEEEGAVKDLEKKQEVAEARKKIDCRRAKSDECMKDEKDLTELLDHLSAARARDKAEAALKEANAIIADGPGQSLAAGPATAAGAPHEIAGIPTLYIIIGALFVAQAGALRTMHGIELIRNGWQAWKQETTIEPDEAELLEQEIARGIVAPKSPEEKAFDRVAIFVHKGGTQGAAKSLAAFAASVKTSPNSLKRYLDLWDSRGVTETIRYEGTAIRVKVLKPWSAAKSIKPLRRAIRRRA